MNFEVACFKIDFNNYILKICVIFVKSEDGPFLLISSSPPPPPTDLIPPTP